jgi:hypothetical protein
MLNNKEIKAFYKLIPNKYKEEGLGSSSKSSSSKGSSSKGSSSKEESNNK